MVGVNTVLSHAKNLATHVGQEAKGKATKWVKPEWHQTIQVLQALDSSDKVCFARMLTKNIKARSTNPFKTEWGRYAEVRRQFREFMQQFSNEERQRLGHQIQSKYHFTVVRPQEAILGNSNLAAGYNPVKNEILLAEITDPLVSTYWQTSHEFRHRLQNIMGLHPSLDIFQTLYHQANNNINIAQQVLLEPSVRKAFQKLNPQTEQEKIKILESVVGDFLEKLLENPQFLDDFLMGRLRLQGGGEIVPGIINPIITEIYAHAQVNPRWFKKGGLIELDAFLGTTKDMGKELSRIEQLNNQLYGAIIKKILHIGRIAEKEQRFLQTQAAPVYHQWQQQIQSSLEHNLKAVHLQSVTPQSIAPLTDMIVAPFERQMMHQIDTIAPTELKHLYWKLRQEGKVFSELARQKNIQGAIQHQFNQKLIQHIENRLFPQAAEASRVIKGLNHSIKEGVHTPETLLNTLQPVAEKLFAPMDHGSLLVLRKRLQQGILSNQKAQNTAKAELLSQWETLLLNRLREIEAPARQMAS